jgi:hypothetical protein
MTMNVIERTDDLHRLVTVEEACELLRMHQAEVVDLIYSGELPTWGPARPGLLIPWWVFVHQVSKDNGVDLPPLDDRDLALIDRPWGTYDQTQANP